MRAAIGCVFILVNCMAFAQKCPVIEITGQQVPTVVDCSTSKDDLKGSRCEIPIVTAAELYSALAGALTDIGAGKMGFPVDILAASYGIDDPGWSFAWSPWKFRRALIEKDLRSLKRRPEREWDMPSLITVNLPSNGFHFYDAAVVRSLFETELFPFDLGVVQIKASPSTNTNPSGSETTTSYVVINSKLAKEAKALFTKISDCAEPETLPKGGGAPNTSEPGSSLSESASAVIGDDAGASGQAQLPWILSSLPVRKLAITLEIEKNSQWLSGKWRNRTEGDRKYLSDLLGEEGCLMTIVVRVPRGADAGYASVDIAGTINDRLKCAPSDFGKKDSRADSRDCSGGSFRWVIYRPELRKGLGEDLELATPYNLSHETLIVLSGARIGPIARPVISCWCSPKKCTEKQLNKCQSLGAQ